MLLSEGQNPAVSNVRQLQYGYNSLLGLTPYQQQIVYMRNAIFEFHLSPQNVFLLLQGQAGTTSEFDTPL